MRYDISKYNVKLWGPTVYSRLPYEYFGKNVHLAIHSLYCLYLISGYSVAWGRFLKYISNIWYAVAAPRGAKLSGEVLLHDPKTNSIRKIFHGDQKASYFGYSLLGVDTDSDTADDLLIGAPMYTLDAYDEGCVYFYKSNGYVCKLSN